MLGELRVRASPGLEAQVYGAPHAGVRRTVECCMEGGGAQTTVTTRRVGDIAQGVGLYKLRNMCYALSHMHPRFFL